MINEWYKKWSVWLSLIFGVVAALEANLPLLQGMLPPQWYMYAFIAVAIARVIKQSGVLHAAIVPQK